MAQKGKRNADHRLLLALHEAQRLEWWLGEQTYNRGVFDEDAEFRPAWSHYHRLWEVHTGGWSPLHAVWAPREEPVFEEARQSVLPIMVRVLQRQPRPVEFLGRLLASLAADAGATRPASE